MVINIIMVDKSNTSEPCTRNVMLGSTSLKVRKNWGHFRKKKTEVEN